MKNAIKILILFLVFSLLTLYSFAQCPLDIGQSPTVSNTGQILYFPFNGNATNQGSGSYTATVSGATYTTGICGQAMDFDGINDYLKLNPFVPMTGNFTIATWIYIDNMQSNLAIFATRDQCTSSYRGYSQAEFFINYYNSVQGNYPQELNFNVNQHQNCTGYSAGDRYNAQNFTFTASSWHFIALKVQNNSSDSRTVSFFIDCQLHATTQYMNYPSNSSFSSSNNNKSFIGAASDVTNYIYSFNGKIDEFRLYNRVLSNTELQNLYYKCKPVGVNINKYIGNCTGDSAIIEIINSQKAVSYYLFDSTNQQTIGAAQIGGCSSLFFSTGLVTSPTDFYIKAIDVNSACQIVLDTVISLNPNYGGYNMYDTLEICKGDSIFIRGDYYTAPNLIIDTLFDISGCDSILNTNLLALPIPAVNLGNDTAFCDGDSILLSIPNNYHSILWNTGVSTSSIYVNTTGTYWVEVSDSVCSNRDSVEVTNLSNTYITINDTSFCDGEKWVISLPSSNSYLWSTGSTNSSISIQDSGQYWVQIKDICKNYTENFNVEVLDCSCMMAVPNVFTPNKDGLNDYFFPVINCIFDEYHIVIYNRWGQLLFESDDQNAKWDGKYKGGEAPDGVYFYLITYKHLLTSDKEGQRSGSVTIFR
jgi:gliding motility-associated-like protein